MNNTLNRYVRRLKLNFKSVVFLLYDFSFGIWLKHRNQAVSNQIYLAKYRGKYIALLHSDAIGTLIQFSIYAIRYCVVNSIDYKNDLVFIAKSASVNLTYIELLKKKFTVVTDEKFFNALYNNCGYNTLYKKGLYIKDIVPDDIRNGMQYLTTFNVALEFTPDEIKYGYTLLEKIGIHKEDKIVTVHNKDPGYFKKRHYNRPYTDSYRDSAFSELENTIKYLIGLSFKVIRIGQYDNAAPAYSLNSLSEKERDFIDIFLGYAAEFAICGDSGIALIPYIFNKPILYHNFIPLGESPVVENGFILPKMLYSKDKKRKIKFNELETVTELIVYRERGKHIRRIVTLDKFQSNVLYRLNNIIPLENDSDEILSAVKEFLDIKIYKKKQSDEYSVSQRKFKMQFDVNHPMRNSNYYVPKFICDMENNC